MTEKILIGLLGLTIVDPNAIHIPTALVDTTASVQYRLNYDSKEACEKTLEQLKKKYKITSYRCIENVS